MSLFFSSSSEGRRSENKCGLIFRALSFWERYISRYYLSVLSFFYRELPWIYFQNCWSNKDFFTWYIYRNNHKNSKSHIGDKTVIKNCDKNHISPELKLQAPNSIQRFFKGVIIGFLFHFLSGRFHGNFSRTLFSEQRRFKQ